MRESNKQNLGKPANVYIMTGRKRKRANARRSRPFSHLKRPQPTAVRASGASSSLKVTKDLLPILLVVIAYFYLHMMDVAARAK